MATGRRVKRYRAVPAQGVQQHLPSRHEPQRSLARTSLFGTCGGELPAQPRVLDEHGALRAHVLRLLRAVSRSPVQPGDYTRYIG